MSMPRTLYPKRLDGQGFGARMRARHRAALSRWSLWSSFAMVPATWLLLFGGAPVVAALYLASLAATLAYHASFERRFVRVDRVLAYGVIGSNCWMTLRSEDLSWTAFGVLFVLLALGFYHQAKQGRRTYDFWHSLWHLACGVAGLCFVQGYLA